MARSEAWARAQAGYQRLRNWLVGSAAPLWSTTGVDSAGLFEEMIGLDGWPCTSARRARVQPRQLYALAVARRLGATIPQRLFADGLKAYLAAYLRSDGLVRSLIGPNGQVLDERAALYDQAFALLALAHLKPILGAGAEATAQELRSAVLTAFPHGGGGFWSFSAEPAELLSNPHMHLLEACLAWMEAGGDATWSEISAQIVSLALDRFVDPLRGGGLKEYFTSDWTARPDLQGRIIEPGHQFEWAWLLLCWSRLQPNHRRMLDARVTALRLIRIGEERGVDAVRNVAVNALLDDFSVHDAQARLWPQTERLKAWSVVNAQCGGFWWSSVVEAIESLELYLATSVPGLWFDRMSAAGAMLGGPAPASSLYHIVCAIETLGQALEEVAGTADAVNLQEA